MECKNCYRSVPEDSSFCPYCGGKVEAAKELKTYRESPYKEDFREVSIPDILPEGVSIQSQKSEPIWPIVVLLAVLACIVGIVIAANAIGKPDSGLQPVAEPRSGEVIIGAEDLYGSEITVTAPSGEACFVKLKTVSGVTRLGFYVRAGETVTVGVPCEYLYVYFASGKTWYGFSNLFGERTSYSMDDEVCDFSEYTWEYTLYPVSDGNFSQTPIDEDEF